MNTRTMLIVAGGLALTALSPAFADDTRAQIKRMDTDGDGRISRPEYFAEAQIRFNKLDTNGDGVVAAAELYSRQDPKNFGSRAGADASAPTPTARLGQVDRNGDGQISRAENEADAEAHFVAMDTDRDGFLSEQELDAGARR